jgi:hypothetical protein
MGLADSFGKEDRVDVTFTNFYNLVKGNTTADILVNAVKADVPHKYIRAMLTGEKETEEEMNNEMA